MIKKKTKIHPHLSAEIVRRAAELPPIVKMRGGQPVTHSVVVPGTEVTAADLKPGTPLNPNLHYKINRLVFENHAENMVKGVQMQGVKFVDEYCAGVTAMYNDMKRQTEAQKSIKAKIIKFLYKLTSLSWLKKRKNN